MRARHKLARVIRRWHARLGVASALFFGVLVVTGIALNHTESLGLAHIPVRSAALVRWLGLPTPAVLSVVELDTPLIATRDAWLYRDQPLPEGNGEVLGAVRTPALLAVATARQLVLYTLTGERIDTLTGDALPGLPLAALGQNDATALVVRTPRGTFASVDGLAWQPHGGAAARWSHPAPPSAAQAKHATRLLVPALPLERLVLDIHSGRFFGRYGPWLVDAVAAILLVLASSGLWIQWQGWRQKQRHAHRN